MVYRVGLSRVLGSVGRFLGSIVPNCAILDSFKVFFAFLTGNVGIFLRHLVAIFSVLKIR